jgi:hypothetical protein
MLHDHDYGKHTSPSVFPPPPPGPPRPDACPVSEADMERLADLALVRSDETHAFLTALALELHRTRAVFFGARTSASVPRACAVVDVVGTQATIRSKH